MSAIGAPTPPARKSGIVGWIKRNKVLAGGAAVGASVLILSRSGSSSGDASGGSGIIDAEGNQATVSDGPVQLVPVSAPASEGSTDTDFTDTGTDNQAVDDTSGNVEPGTTVIVNVPQPTVALPANSPTPASTAGQGVTVSGKFFPGATSSVRTGVNRNQYGDYQVWKITFPGRAEYWWHYVKQGNWTGPHTGSHGDDVQNAAAQANAKAAAADAAKAKAAAAAAAAKNKAAAEAKQKAAAKKKKK